MASLPVMQQGGATALPNRPHALRPCPPDFDETYVRVGYDECEVIYRAAPMTVKRWLLERGAERLRAARAAYVEQLRAERRAGKCKARPSAVQPVSCAYSREVVREAANWLRTMRNGGWFCAPTGQGDWWLGSTRRTPAQIVEYAAAKGFNLADANLRHAVEAGNA